MTDDDCLAPADWAAQMVSVFEEYPRAGVVFCRIEAMPYDQNLGDTPVVLCDDEREFTRVRAELGFNLMGAGMGVRRDAIQSLQGFDAALGPGGTFCSGEDVDVAIRMLLSGRLLVRTNRTKITHDGFRPRYQARTLLVRNLTGVGAVMGKFTRLGNTAVLALLLSYTCSQLGLSFRHLLREGTPRGLKQVFWMYRAVYYAWRTPVDRTTALFAMSPQKAEKLAFLLIDA